MACVFKEIRIDVPPEAVWSAVGGRSAHHDASMQVFAEGESRTRLVWITDVLPDEVADDVRMMVEQGAGVIKKTLEHRGAS